MLPEINGTSVQVRNYRARNPTSRRCGRRKKLEGRIIGSPPRPVSTAYANSTFHRHSGVANRGSLDSATHSRGDFRRLPRCGADAHIFAHPCPANQPVFTTTAGQLPPRAPSPIVHGLPARRRAARDRVYLRRPAIMGMIAKSYDLCPLATRNSYWTDPAMASCTHIWLRSNSMHLAAQMHSADCAMPSAVPRSQSRGTCITSVAPTVGPWEQTAELENESLLRQSRGSCNFGDKLLDQHADGDRLEMCGHGQESTP